MTPAVVWNEKASDDLLDLYNWIATRSDFETAFSYTRKVKEFADRLALFPRRGTPRDEIEEGLRSVVYTGRTIVFYKVGNDGGVEIARVAHGGRNLETMFDRDDRS